MRKTKPADINTIRENNLSLVINIIREVGSISRAELVRQTHLSATTISSLVSVLLDSGFVQESGIGESSGGRPPILLHFNYTFRHVLGVDMGATHIAAVAMDLQGHVIAREFCMFDVMSDPAGTTARIVDLVQQVMEKAKLNADAILGMGVAVPAPLEGENLDQLSSVILPRWADHDLLAEIKPRHRFPIYLDNDANAGVIAEKWWGMGTETANLAYIKLGTGVGCGLMVNNEIYRGDSGTAGEIGHTTINPAGPPCRCGNQGCLESMVGIAAIVTESRERLSKNVPNWNPNTALTLSKVIEAALSGDPTTRSIIENAGSFLGIAVANLINLFNPGLIILGGDLVTAGALLLNPMQAAVSRRAMPKAAHEVKIAVSQLGDDAIAMGAATLAIRNAFQPASLIQTLSNQSQV